MFTMQDFHKIKSGIKSMGQEEHFSPKLSPIAYAISRLNSTAIGECGEKLMARYLRRKKYHVRRIGNRQSIDILLDGKLRCEVKTGTMQLNNTGNRTAKYVLRHVKPELFDILFMVFITPKGIVVKWTEQKYAMKYLETRKRGKDGYAICFDATCDNEKLAYNDNIEDFVKYYPSMSSRIDQAVACLLRKEL